MISRKDFLKTGALSALTIPAMGLPRATQAAPAKKSYDGDAKNVIFIVADGMSHGTFALGDLVKSRQYGQHLHWTQLYNQTERPYHRGLMDMASANSIVTDSAAAASSWGSGQRINNGGINWSTEGKPLRSILPIFRDAGKKTGLVTTTRMTHATPASFATAVSSRNFEDQIAEQYLEAKVDVLMGGGHRHFAADRRDDGKDLYGEFRKAGYTIARNKSEMMSASSSDPILGIYSDSHLPYTTDHKTDAELASNVPTLAEMTVSALERLDSHPDGFILQIEGGRVDHAAHGNDVSGLIYDMIAFDDAVGEVLAFTENRDDTLVIITTDHGNANPGINGAGPGYSNAPLMLDQLHNFRHTNEWVFYNLPEEPTAGQVRELLMEATQLDLAEMDIEMVMKAMKGELATPYRAERTASSVLGKVLANYVSVNFIGDVHTGDYVELAVLGPGMDRMDSFTRNTELFDLMVDMAGVRAMAKSA